MPLIFPFAEYWSFYGFFTLFVLSMLALDLGVFHRKAHAVSFKEAAIWTVVWISLALFFNLGLYYYLLDRLPTDPTFVGIAGFDADGTAKNIALEFLTGFVIEKSLAIDNIFVFVIVFSYFAIPLQYQHRVLFYGIIGALIFRAIFIALGAVLMQYQFVVWIFGVFLILTGIKMMIATEKQIKPDQNPLIKLLKKIIPIHPHFEGDKFLVKVGGVVKATPLLVALVFLEFSDIIFAVDSVPAIFAITKEPFIVFTSNVFAILGLRSMYFMLAGVVDKFEYLKYGLAAVLIFVGLKMVWLNEAFGGKFPIGFSLGIIGLLIGSSIAISLIATGRRKS